MYLTDDLIWFGGGIRISPPDHVGTIGLNTMTELDQIEEEILTCDVSDETLENAAGTGKAEAGNFTLGSCTGFISCPPQ
jgi:hypothetical protein